MASLETNEIMVLTGAGFTKNFGGFLGSEMWSQIFNDTAIQDSPKLRELLQDNYDFEAIYSEVLDRAQYSQEEKDIIKNVIRNAYKRLDDTIKDWRFTTDSAYPVNIYGLGDLLGKTIMSSGKPSMFFTLNQDLFVERRWGHPSPGVQRFASDFYNMSTRELKQNEFVALPRESVEEKVTMGMSSHNGIHYIKLHGSYGWKSSDGADQLVIGTNKESLIQKEPLLNCYYQMFQNAIQEGDKKLLVIGYGFRDKHINLALLNGVKNRGLKLYLITTQNPEDLKYHFERGGHYYAKDILKGLRGYYPYPLKEIFPGDQSTTTHFTDIKNALRR